MEEYQEDANINRTAQGKNLTYPGRRLVENSSSQPPCTGTSWCIGYATVDFKLPFATNISTLSVS